MCHMVVCLWRFEVILLCVLRLIGYGLLTEPSWQEDAEHAVVKRAQTVLGLLCHQALPADTVIRVIQGSDANQRK